MKLSLLLVAPLLAATLAAAPAAPVPDVHRHPSRGAGGTAAFVRVGDGPLVFTAQLTAPEVNADAAAQAEGALRALDAALGTAGADLGRVVRLNAYVARETDVAAVEQAVARRFAGAPVAFSLVRTPLERDGAAVAFDAVATASRSPESVEVLSSAGAILPRGEKLFISGQAERGADLAAGARLTMAGLHRSLAHLGLKRSDVVQVKAFIKPFSDHAAARRAIAASFEGGAVPPIVLLEWKSDLFAEIELVASARSLSAKPEAPIVHAWLPWLTKSTRYCHVATIAAGTPLIFLGAVDGTPGPDARAQMKTIFERLGSVLFDAGSSYRHLAKATYYLNDRAARALLGEIRGVYFDPLHPPAASALDVAGLGGTGRTAMLDLIAVPAK